jgi:hypothetical protein
MDINKRILVIPLSRDMQRVISPLELECNCVLRKNKERFSFKAIRLALDELLLSRSFLKKFKVTPTKRTIFLCKLLIKRPTLITSALFFRQSFQLSMTGECSQHSLVADKTVGVWYSGSAARQGFPWSYDVFLNSLAIIRNRDIQILVFGLGFDYGNTVNGSLSEKSTGMDVPSDTLKMKMSTEDLEVIEVPSWKNTKLLELKDAEITHGTVLSKNSTVFVQDLDFSFQELPSHLIPNSLWYSKKNSEGVLLNTPKSEFRELELDSCVFINSLTDNFYHFISESMRVIIMCIEVNIKIDNIIIRSDLPKQFYEIIQQICPNSLIIKLDKGKKVRVRRVIFTQYQLRLSLDKSLFRGMPIQHIRESDEWITWSWLRDRFLLNNATDSFYYIPRRSHQSRGIFNSRHLEKKMNRANFQILDTENSSFENQRLNFGSARIVCCSSGASLLNIIFMPKGSTVLEICYPSGDSWEFLAKLYGIKYSKIQIRSFLPRALIESLDIYYSPVTKILNRIQELK